MGAIFIGGVFTLLLLAYLKRNACATCGEVEDCECRTEEQP